MFWAPSSSFLQQNGCTVRKVCDQCDHETRLNLGAGTLKLRASLLCRVGLRYRSGTKETAIRQRPCFTVWKPSGSRAAGSWKRHSPRATSGWRAKGKTLDSTITKAGPPVRVPAQAAVPGARAVRAMSSSKIGLVVAPGGAGAFRGSGGSGRGRGSQRLEGNTQSSSSLPGVSATRAACWASGRAQCPAGWQPGSESAFSGGGCRVSAGPGGGRSNACKSLAGGRHDPASKIFHGVALHICGISKGDEHSCRQGRPGNVHRLGCYSRWVWKHVLPKVRSRCSSKIRSCYVPDLQRQ